MTVASVTGEDFEAMVLQAKAPVVVDFYATWCGPCKMVAPILDELSGTYEGKIRFCKVDIDEAPDIANQYSVTGVPTLIVFKGGQEADRKVSALPKPVLSDWLASQLA